MIRHRRRRTAAWFVLVLVFAAAGPGLAQAPPAAWPAILTSTGFTVPVASGILYSHFGVSTNAGPLDIHHLRVDLANPMVRVGVGLARDRLMSDDEPVSSMVLRSGAIAGVNADYYDIHESGMPLNMMVKDGLLLRSPWRFVALAVAKDRTAGVARFRWSGSVGIPDTSESHALAGYNSGLVQDGIVAISAVRGYGAPPPDPGTRQTVVELTPANDATEFIVKPDSVTPVAPGPPASDAPAPAAPAPVTPAPAAPAPTEPPAGDEGRYFVKQIWPQQAFYAPLPKGEMILLGRGSGADWLAQKLTAGEPVQVNLNTDPDWHAYQTVVGGGPVLVRDGQVARDPDPPAPEERDHRFPVIAAGVARDGRTITFVVVDGRQPNLSIGLTRPELASYMQWLGAYQAIAFDSGGSATMVARLPGQPAPAVLNSPSDGRERPVANAVLVYSTSVPGPAVKLLINANQPLRLFAGAAYPVSIIGLDEQGNPVPPPGPLEVSAPPPLAGYGGGYVRAGPAAGEGTLKVSSGGAAGTARVSVVTRVRRLFASQESISLAPGAGWSFSLAAQDGDGHALALPESAGTWVVSPPWLGTISAPGEFVAGDRAGTGTITAHLGGAGTQVRVFVINTARPVNRFDRGDWSFRGYPDTVTGAVALVNQPSHERRPSGQLTFRLDGPANRAAYLVTRLPISGAPIAMTLWVYGDGSGVWLRGTYEQASGPPGSITFARAVTWKGWRSVTATLPAGLAYPITWTSFYVVETDPNRAPHGSLFLSSPRAIYPQR